MAKATTSAQDIKKQAEQAGFTVDSSQTGKLELRKSGCVGYLETRSGGWEYSGTPYLIVQGLKCELEDRGYQKFWLAKAEGKRFPIRKVDLQVLHHFDEEVRQIAHSKSLYNESLGSTNARTVYDRLEGRPDR